MWTEAREYDIHLIHLLPPIRCLREAGLSVGVRIWKGVVPEELAAEGAEAYRWFEINPPSKGFIARKPMMEL